MGRDFTQREVSEPEVQTRTQQFASLRGPDPMQDNFVLPNQLRQ